mgnify:FL=1
MAWVQKQISLGPFRRGFHLVTRQILDAVPELREFEIGQLQVFIQHTSASVTISENADVEVRTDLEAVFNQLAPESFPYEHTYEGDDDMPAHVKSVLLGSSVLVPISRGQLALGTWQGIYLWEHRHAPHRRSLVMHVLGE